MAVVNGEAYKKAYIDEPKSFIGAGKSHGSPHYVYDDVASANTNDKVFFGKLPPGSRIIEAKTLNGVSISLEDGDGNSISVGDEVSELIDIVAVPAAGLTNDVILCQYLQN